MPTQRLTTVLSGSRLRHSGQPGAMYYATRPNPALDHCVWNTHNSDLMSLALYSTKRRKELGIVKQIARRQKAALEKDPGLAEGLLPRFRYLLVKTAMSLSLSALLFILKHSQARRSELFGNSHLKYTARKTKID